MGYFAHQRPKNEIPTEYDGTKGGCCGPPRKIQSHEGLAAANARLCTSSSFCFTRSNRRGRATVTKTSPLAAFPYFRTPFSVPPSVPASPWPATGGISLPAASSSRARRRPLSSHRSSAVRGRARAETPRPNAALFVSCIPNSRTPGCDRNCGQTPLAAQRGRGTACGG